YRRKRRIDHALDIRRGPKTCVEVRPSCTPRHEQVADILIRLDVGSPESVYGLLGIADDKQLPRHRLHMVPVTVGRICGREPQENFGLERIGVLEFIDEQMREARLKSPPHLGM